MDFDVSDILASIDPVLMLSAIFIGAVVGFLYFPHLFIHRPKRYAVSIAIFFIGLTFCVMMGSDRYFEGYEQWERWLGIALLWTLFSVGTYLGVELEHRVRERKENRGKRTQISSNEGSD